MATRKPRNYKPTNTTLNGETTMSEIPEVVAEEATEQTQDTVTPKADLYMSPAAVKDAIAELVAPTKEELPSLSVEDHVAEDQSAVLIASDEATDTMKFIWASIHATLEKLTPNKVVTDKDLVNLQASLRNDIYRALKIDHSNVVLMISSVVELFRKFKDTSLNDRYLFRGFRGLSISETAARQTEDIYIFLKAASEASNPRKPTTISKTALLASLDSEAGIQEAISLYLSEE